MKFSLITYVTAGAVLAQVGASPIGIMISETSPSNFLRLGHPAVAGANIHALTPDVAPATDPVPAVPGPVATTIEIEFTQMGSGRKPCGRFRQKAIEASNRLRQALGLPLIETGPHMHHHGMLRPLSPVSLSSSNEDGIVRILPIEAMPLPVMYSGHRHAHHPPGHALAHGSEKPSFTRRLNFALMALGPWEGRAVAFVLGCGIGVLVRMLWVLAVIGYRSFFGRKQEEIEYHHILFTEPLDAEEILVPPPTYGYVDEKAPLMAADALAEEAEEERK